MQRPDVPTLSIAMPVYNGSHHLGQALASILSETFTDFEIVISDDCSTDDTPVIAAGTGDKRVRIRYNRENLGYVRNVSAAIDATMGRYVMLFAQDDVLLPGSLARTVHAFALAPNVGVVTRPYYWFDRDVHRPLREVEPYDRNRDSVVSIHDGPKAISTLFATFGQLSGLTIKRELAGTPCSPYVFTAHVAPFAAALRTTKAVCLSQPTVAVRTSSSQTRSHPEIYDPPPLATWIWLGDDVFGDPELTSVRDEYRRFLGTSNYVGLIQTRNYGSMRILFNEMQLYIQLYPKNIIDPRFWAIAIVAATVPPPLLRRMTDLYKERMLGPWIEWKRRRFAR